jgi:hypothetical protein
LQAARSGRFRRIKQIGSLQGCRLGSSTDNPSALAAEALRLEQEVAALVNAAYGLTAEEVALMWQTAPPRMPCEPPRKEVEH